MMKLGRVTKFKMLFLVVVFVFNFDLFKFSAAILEKGLLISDSFFSCHDNNPADTMQKCFPYIFFAVTFHQFTAD